MTKEELRNQILNLTAKYYTTNWEPTPFIPGKTPIPCAGRVFVDITIPTYNIHTSYMYDAITPKTKAIMVAHTLGNPFYEDIVLEMAKKYNLWVIEDCCDALGSTYMGRNVGTFGDLATVSFY